MAGEGGEVLLARAYAPYGETQMEIPQSPNAAITPYGFTGEWTDATGLVYLRARYYSPWDGRFVSRDTWGGNANRPLSYNKWLYGFDNPSRYKDSSGHYEQDVHTDLTYDIVYKSAFEHVIRQKGFNYAEEAKIFAKTLAAQISQADRDVDYNLADNALMRPGIYIRCDQSGHPYVVFVPTTLHYYATPAAESALWSAETPYEFGRALHAYQDSFAHWQKLGRPGTAGEIWDAHAANDLLAPLVMAGLLDRHALIDTFDPGRNPVHPDWGIIDANMKEGMKSYIKYSPYAAS